MANFSLKNFFHLLISNLRDIITRERKTKKMEESIAAISTAIGKGAISIVRVSGVDALSIVNKIFKGKDLTKVKSHTIHYGFIMDHNEEIDEVLVMVMLAPNTYTREDIVEINCHGGISTTNKILNLLIDNGARLAEPGEFTKRAFLNGRINLAEAEAVSDLINSKSDKQRSLAMNSINGRLTKIIKTIRENMLNILANIAVNIDYPEYDDVPEMTQENLKKSLLKVQSDLQVMLKNAEIGKIIKEGLDVALVGRPNVGKSSLLNALLNEDKAIVTNISGTTRDLIEGTTNIAGISLNLIDTAGIHQTDDIIEQMGVKKSKEIISKADLIIFVLNNNEELEKEDEEIYDQIKTKTHLIFVNKSDLEQKIKIPKNWEYILGNTTELNGLEELKNKIIQMYHLDQIDAKENTYLSNIRQVHLAKESLQNIQDALNDIQKNIPIDMIEIYIRNAWEKLGLLIGETYEDELIDKLFKNFCLGK